MSTRNYDAVQSIEELADLVDRVITGGTSIAIDIETGYDGPDREKFAVHPETAFIVGFSFTDSTDWARYVPLAHDNGENLDNEMAAGLLWEMVSTGRAVAHNCFAGETEFLTSAGLRTLRETVGQTLEVWTSEGWAAATVECFGRATVREVVLAPFNRSRSLIRRRFRATDNHRWVVERIKYPRRVRSWQRVPGYVTTAELRPGDKIRALAPDIKPDTYSDAFRHGLIYADGALTSDKRTSNGDWTHQLRLCGWKAIYADRFERVSYPPSAKGDPVVNSYHAQTNLKMLPPPDASPQYLADFIAGWVELDGDRHVPYADTRIVSTVKREDAEWLERYAAQAGWWVTGVNVREAGSSSFAPGLTIYSITLSRHSDMAWTVVQVGDSSVEEDVYCPVVPGIERFTLGCGAETANCSFELRHLSRFFRKHLWDNPNHGKAVQESNGYFRIRSDTMVEAYLMAEYERFGLKSLTKQMFDHTMIELHELFPDLPKNKLKFLRFNVLELTPKVVEYACEDSVWCLAIHQRYYEQVIRDFPLLYKVEKALVQDVLPRMEDEGILYDWAQMKSTADRLRIFRDKFNAEIMAELSELAGEPIAINLASPPQIGKTLFDKLGYTTTVYTDKTRELPPDQRKMSTGKIALERLAQQYPVVQKIREWKQITRLLGTYLEKYEGLYNYADDGRAHPNHLSAFVVTGRFAVSDPPYQGSPRKYHYDLIEATAAHERSEEPPPGTCFKFNFRDMIIAPPDHYILGFDLSQAELRAIAGEAQETALIEAFENREDVHVRTASLMKGIPIEEVTKEQRNVGKTMAFALLYGMGVKSLADRLGISVEEAQSLMDKYFAGYPNIATYINRQVAFGQENKYVTSRFGRKLPIWEYKSDKRWIQQKGDRACVNYAVQWAATGDYMKIAMVRAVGAIKAAGLSDKIKLVMNIHDALEFYVHQSVEPQDAIALLQPAVIFSVDGWPKMKADWHIARKWGSPTELDVREDGSIYAGEKKIYDPNPGVIEDEDGEEVYELPEVDREVLLEVAQSPGRRIILRLAEMPLNAAWSDFLVLAQSKPGNNLIRVQTPEGSVDLPFACGLRPDDLGAVSALLGVVFMQFEPAPEQLAAMADGLTL